MANAKFDAAGYAVAMKSLLPQGRVWQINEGSSQAAVIDGLALTTQRSDSAAISLIQGAFPATADQLISEWNQTLGIIDPCFGAPTSSFTNQQQIVAKLSATGGQSPQYFIDLALSLGYVIKITQYTYHSVMKPVTAALSSKDWALTWQVDFAVANSYTASVEQSVGSPIGSGGYPANMQAVICILNKYKPAHTNLIFKFN